MIKTLTDKEQLKKGDRVKVVQSSQDETFDTAFAGKEGTVSAVIIRNEVGARPSDPSIKVEFEDGSSDWFWTEELILQNRKKGPGKNCKMALLIKKLADLCDLKCEGCILEKACDTYLKRQEFSLKDLLKYR